MVDVNPTKGICAGTHQCSYHSIQTLCHSVEKEVLYDMSISTSWKTVYNFTSSCCRSLDTKLFVVLVYCFYSHLYCKALLIVGRVALGIGFQKVSHGIPLVLDTY